MPDAQRILLVEDNLHNRRIFSGVLKHYGFIVTEAENGQEAVDFVAAGQTFDVILMDLSLPVVDGWEATRQIKKLPASENVPIIALTAHAMAGDEDRALEAGCDYYLSKPISPKKVVAEVQRVLGLEVSSEA